MLPQLSVLNAQVLMILGMTQNTTLLDGGTRVLSHSVDLGYVDRLLAALPVVLARCGHRPDDHYRSLPILKMAMHRELRTTLQEANLAPTLTRWLTSRSGREQVWMPSHHGAHAANLQLCCLQHSQCWTTSAGAWCYV